MITKGIIKSIDLLGNTCTVHLPFFETAGNDPIIETATVSNTPGSYNGYKVGDVVYVAFEDGSMSTPVVIGKLYLGTEKEKADPRGVSNVEESTATKKATLPADAKLAAEIDSNVPNTTVPYSSLSSIANGLNTLNTNVGQMDRDYGNRFKQVIYNADGLKSELEQTAENMVAKVSGYELDAEGNPIQGQFGWSLQKDSWTVFNGNKTILTADKKGLHVSGQVDAESGHIGGFTITDTKLFAGENSTFVSLGSGDTYYEYITFTGSQIISLHDKKDDTTDLHINYFTDTVEITAQLDISDTTTTKVIFGYLGQAGRRIAALYARGNASKIMWGYSSPDGTLEEIDTGITRADTRVHTYKIAKGTLYVDGIAKGVAQTMHDNLKECPLAIGGAYVYGKYEYFLNGKIYSIKVTLPEGSKFKATGTNVSEWFPDTQGTEYGLRLLNSILPDDEFDYNFETPINNTSLSGDVERKKAIYLGSENPRTAPFSVTNTGELTATKGKIGGFTIADNSLSAGSGTSTVVLSPDAILLGGTTTSEAPFSVGHDGYVHATQGEVGGWGLTSENFTKEYTGSNNSSEVVELSPKGINFTNTGGTFSALSGVYKTNHYAGIDTTRGLGVYGDKITRIFQTSSTANSWQNAFRASVPGIIPNKSNWASTENITLLIYDKVTISNGGNTATWSPNVLTGNITSIASVFVSGGSGTTGLSVSAYVSNNTIDGTKAVKIETSAAVTADLGATIYLLALCAVNPSPRVAS